jgi:hypothetical protein
MLGRRAGGVEGSPREETMHQHIDRDLQDRFPTDPTGLPVATGPQVLELADGDTLDLRIGPWPSASAR